MVMNTSDFLELVLRIKRRSQANALTQEFIMNLHEEKSPHTFDQNAWKKKLSSMEMENNHSAENVWEMFE